MMARRVEAFATGATRESDTDKLDYEGFLDPAVLRRYAEYMHRHRKQADGTMRGSDNWQAGMPRGRYIKSLLRHVFELWLWWRGSPIEQRTERDSQNVEEVLCAVIFNAQGLMREILLSREVEG